MKSNHLWLYIQLLVNTICCIYGRQEHLLFSTENNVKKVDLDTGVVTDLAYLNGTLYSIAYDVKEGYVYVPIRDKDVIVRFPYPNDDQTVKFETVINTFKPFYVAFDSGNSHIYWTEHGISGKIMRCNLDGSDLTTIVNEYKPTALTLDTHNRWIYYSTVSSNALHRVTFEGKEKLVVLNRIGLATDIDIDIVDKRVYWMEFENGDLKSALYNGSDVKTLVSTNVKFNYREIDIGGDYVFYTSSNIILKIHKSSGQIPAVMHTDTRQIYGLLFYKQESTTTATTTTPLTTPAASSSTCIFFKEKACTLNYIILVIVMLFCLALMLGIGLYIIRKRKQRHQEKYGNNSEEHELHHYKKFY